MSATPPGPSGDLLDQATPDTLRLSVAEATTLGERALLSLGLPDDDVRIIVEQLFDNALCGYPSDTEKRSWPGMSEVRIRIVRVHVCDHRVFGLWGKRRARH